MEQQPLQEETIAQRLKDNEHLIDELAEGDIGALVELLHNVLSPNTPKVNRKNDSINREDYITTETLVNVFLWDVANPGVQPDIKETIMNCSVVATDIPEVEYLIDTMLDHGVGQRYFDATLGGWTSPSIQECLYVADNFLTLIEDTVWLVPVWTHTRYEDKYYRGFCIIQRKSYPSYGTDKLC